LRECDLNSKVGAIEEVLLLSDTFSEAKMGELAIKEVTLVFR